MSHFFGGNGFLGTSGSKSIFSNPGQLLGAIAPIGLNFLLPGLGAALGGALDIGTTAGSGLLGAGVGGLTSSLTGGNALTGALMGGVGGAIAPNLGDIGNSIGSNLDSAESYLGGSGSFGDDFGTNSLFGSTPTSSASGSGFLNSANGSPLGATSAGGQLSSSLGSVTGSGGTGLGVGGGGGGISAFGGSPTSGSTFGDIGQGFNQATSGFDPSTDGISNAANPSSGFTAGGGYSLPANSAMSGWTGTPSLGAGITSGVAPSTGGIASSIGNGISNAYNGSVLQSGVNGVSNGISDAYHDLGLGSSDGLSAGGALPAVASSTIPGSNFWNTAKAGGILDNSTSGGGLLGGKMGNNFQLGDLLGGINSYMAQNNIANAQKQGFQNAQGYLQPYLNTGTAANSQLGNLLGLNGAAAGQTAQANVLANDPGYQFRLQQGQLGIDRSLNAQGLSDSGAAVKAANDYAQGSASQEYQNAIQNLMGQSNAGQQAAGQIGNYANLSGQANAAALGQQSNVINQGLGGLFGTGQNQLAQLLTRSIFGG